MKVGLDVHGVITHNANGFSHLVEDLHRGGNEVHIMTGHQNNVLLHEELKACGFWAMNRIDYVFSITDYHEAIGTEVKYPTPNNPMIPAAMWDKTKGEYCGRHGIDLLIDDTQRYAEACPGGTHFYWYTGDTNDLSKIRLLLPQVRCLGGQGHPDSGQGGHPGQRRQHEVGADDLQTE